MSRVYIILSLFAIILFPLNAAAEETYCTSDFNLLCPAGQVLRGINNDGSKICVPMSPDSVVAPSSPVGPGNVSGLARCMNITVGLATSPVTQPATTWESGPFIFFNTYDSTRTYPTPYLAGDLYTSVTPFLQPETLSSYSYNSDVLEAGSTYENSIGAISGKNGWRILNCRMGFNFTQAMDGGTRVKGGACLIYNNGNPLINTTATVEVLACRN